MRRIPIEESFVTPEIAAAWQSVLDGPSVGPGFAAMGRSILAEGPRNALLHSRLLVLGEERIAHMDEVGIDVERILFEADYPYEDDAEAVAFMDGAAITNAERRAIYSENATALFGL